MSELLLPVASYDSFSPSGRQLQTKTIFEDGTEVLDRNNFGLMNPAEFRTILVMDTDGEIVPPPASESPSRRMVEAAIADYALAHGDFPYHALK